MLCADKGVIIIVLASTGKTQWIICLDVVVHDIVMACV